MVVLGDKGRRNIAQNGIGPPYVPGGDLLCSGEPQAEGGCRLLQCLPLFCPQGQTDQNVFGHLLQLPFSW